MPKEVALNCPNCGAVLNRDQLICQNCGAESKLQSDCSTLKLKAEITCPKCRSINEKSSWYCTSCQTILTKDTEKVKEKQRKIRLEEDKIRQSLPPQTRDRLEPDEFIYLIFELDNGAYIITDKRVIKNRNGVYQEAKLSEITCVTQPQVKKGLGVFVKNITLYFVVKTSEGELVLGDFNRLDAKSCATFYAWVIRATQNHNLQKKDPRAVFLNLKFL